MHSFHFIMPPFDITNILTQIPLIAIIIWLVLYRDKQFAEERRMWLDELKKHAEAMNKIADALNRLASVESIAADLARRLKEQ